MIQHTTELQQRHIGIKIARSVDLKRSVVGELLGAVAYRQNPEYVHGFLTSAPVSRQ
jgi:hypothetical protein